jgi:hypothetical protein
VAVVCLPWPFNTDGLHLQAAAEKPKKVAQFRHFAHRIKNIGGFYLK